MVQTPTSLKISLERVTDSYLHHDTSMAVHSTVVLVLTKPGVSSSFLDDQDWGAFLKQGNVFVLTVILRSKHSSKSYRKNG